MMTDGIQNVSPARSWYGHDWSVWFSDHKKFIFGTFSVTIGLIIAVMTFFIPALDLKQSIEAAISSFGTTSIAVYMACTNLYFYFKKVNLE